MAAVRHLKSAKIAFWSCDLHPHVILHIRSKFRINWPIWRQNLAKETIFNMASVRHLQFAKFRFFANCPSWELKCASAY